MSQTGLETFDTTVQKTNHFINELMAELGWQDKHKAYLALKATLHALRDRLTVEEVAQLGAQLPMLSRGFYYEGWRPAGKPLKERHKAEFLAHIDHELRRGDPELVARAVFTVLARRVSAGEIADVKQTLPSELRELWP
ncbi:MAG: hypothetical protein JWN44_2883 [Myxococcales bacterium]|nr:hypothetical protein [Myxococcales bacterium]